MIVFSDLLEKLVFTSSKNSKIELIVDYLKHTKDPDRGYAIAAITNGLIFNNLKPSHLKELVQSKVDPVLFKISYDYVGDLGETISLIWPENKNGKIPKLSKLINLIKNKSKNDVKQLIINLLDISSPNQRWALIKLLTGGLRVGVSSKLAKIALAKYGCKDVTEIEEIWHGLKVPYIELFKWLDMKATKPKISQNKIFNPMMLSNPINEKKDLKIITPNNFFAEWKWDGIRVQLVSDIKEKRMFSRTGDDISEAFPEIIQKMNGFGVLDGELLVGHKFIPLPFNSLQKRLNRKKVSNKMKSEFPAFVRVYDILFYNKLDLRRAPLFKRREKLKQWLKENKNECIDLSNLINFKNIDELKRIKDSLSNESEYEGLMIKEKNSFYISGRPKGLWFKWKRNPLFLDTVMMYAQRGHGKRSSYYSDFTFGIWNETEIVPIGKAYTGFTNDELNTLDNWVRSNTVKRFGPVREVKKELVVELAFDSVNKSTRHKSGFALRFPRIHRIRWDKNPIDADNLQILNDLIL